MLYKVTSRYTAKFTAGHWKSLSKSGKYVGAINLIQEVITTSHRPTHHTPFDFTEKLHFTQKLTP
jgi:hypothetical protein